MESKFTDEPKLIKGLVAGEIAAYEEIYAKYYKSLCKYAARMLENESEAEDIVQSLIHKLWENRQTLSSVKNLKSYLYRSVYNGVVNYFKISQHKRNFKDNNLFELRKSEMENFDVSEYRELNEKINRHIEELPDQCRRVFKLSRFENKPYLEIAEDLKITVKAVEANISRALKTLRENLKDYLGLFL